MVVYAGAMLLNSLIVLAIIITVLAAAHVYLNPPSPSGSGLPEVTFPRVALSAEEARSYLRAGVRVFTAFGVDGVPVEAFADPDIDGSETSWLMPPNTIPASSWSDCAAWLKAGRKVMTLGPGGTGWHRTIFSASDFTGAVTDGDPFEPFAYFLVDAEVVR